MVVVLGLERRAPGPAHSPEALVPQPRGRSLAPHPPQHGGVGRRLVDHVQPAIGPSAALVEPIQSVPEELGLMGLHDLPLQFEALVLLHIAAFVVELGRAPLYLGDPGDEVLV